ncbi:MAG: hypothetical protein P4N59_05730 [Negativicutes bacterium]|nr:hypothetical protein [Negativicutes bacterium]
MNRYLTLGIALLLLSGLIDCVRAQDTNVEFWPEEGPRHLGESNKYVSESNAKGLNSAMASGELRPAEFDPDGHWGAAVYGVQLSIRSKTNVFLSGDPIPVSVIIRNTTTNSRSVYDTSTGGETLFFIELESGRIFQPSPGGVSLYGFKELSAKHQIKYDYDLFELARLQSGAYKIRAAQGVVCAAPDIKTVTARTNIFSDILTIKIIPK